ALASVAAHAAPPEIDDDVVQEAAPPIPAPGKWAVVEARNLANGAASPVALVVGIAEERRQSRQASLRVDCAEGRTTVRVEADGLASGSAVLEVRQSLDRGSFVAGAWQVDAEGGTLVLSGDPAVAFLGELHGRTELRLAVVRPLSVPFLLTFPIGEAETA